MSYTSHNVKEEFYEELLQMEELKNTEIAAIVAKNGEKSGFYEVCSKFANISLNASKYRIKGTCDIQGAFKFSDINIAKKVAKKYYIENNLHNLEHYMEAIRIMHSKAVEWNIRLQQIGTVLPEEYNSIYAGKYYNFCELPEDIWKEIAIQVKQYIEIS